MAALTIRNIPEETHRALKIRAARNGRSTEAELRTILEETVRPAERLRLGTELSALGKSLGGLDLSFQRSSEPIEPVEFE